MLRMNNYIEKIKKRINYFQKEIAKREDLLFEDAKDFLIFCFSVVIMILVFYSITHDDFTSTLILSWLFVALYPWRLCALARRVLFLPALPSGSPIPCPSCLAILVLPCSPAPPLY